MLSVELSAVSVLRSVFTVALSVLVWLRRSEISSSRAASCSVVQVSDGFWWGRGRISRKSQGKEQGEEADLESVVYDLLALGKGEDMSVLL